MEYVLRQTDDLQRLNMSGTFTFSDNGKFRTIVNDLRESHVVAATLDMQKVEFIDSAALGMLLLLHDEANKKGVAVTLVVGEGQIKKMLHLSNFEEIFTIEYT